MGWLFLLKIDGFNTDQCAARNDGMTQEIIAFENGETRISKKSAL
jgi:hypothetical protein